MELYLYPPIHLRGIYRSCFTSYIHVRAPSNSGSLRQISVSSVIDFSARITKIRHMNGTTERGIKRMRIASPLLCFINGTDVTGS